MLDECYYTERYQEAMSLIHEGNAMLRTLEEDMLKSRVGTGITIVEGGFYTTRYGDRVGPMRRLTADERHDYPEYEWTDCPVGVNAYQSVWTTEGFYMCDDWRPDDKDLCPLPDTDTPQTRINKPVFKCWECRCIIDDRPDWTQEDFDASPFCDSQCEQGYHESSFYDPDMYPLP